MPPHLAQGVREGSQYDRILEGIERKQAQRARERWIEENPLEYQRQLEQQARDGEMWYEVQRRREQAAAGRGPVRQDSSDEDSAVSDAALEGRDDRRPVLRAVQNY